MISYRSNQFVSQDHDPLYRNKKAFWSGVARLRMNVYKDNSKSQLLQIPSYDIFIDQQFIIKFYMEKCPLIRLTKLTGC